MYKVTLMQKLSQNIENTKKKKSKVLGNKEEEIGGGGARVVILFVVLNNEWKATKNRKLEWGSRDLCHFKKCFGTKMGI